MADLTARLQQPRLPTAGAVVETRITMTPDAITQLLTNQWRFVVGRTLDNGDLVDTAASSKYAITQPTYGGFGVVIMKKAKVATEGELPWSTRQGAESHSIKCLRNESTRLRRFRCIPGIMRELLYGVELSGLSKFEFLILPLLKPITDYYAQAISSVRHPKFFVQELMSAIEAIHHPAIGFVIVDIRLKNVYIQHCELTGTFKAVIGGFEHGVVFGSLIENTNTCWVERKESLQVDYPFPSPQGRKYHNVRYERWMLASMFYDLYFHAARKSQYRPYNLTFDNPQQSYEVAKYAKDGEMWHFCSMLQETPQESTTLHASHPFLYNEKLALEFVCVFVDTINEFIAIRNSAHRLKDLKMKVSEKQLNMLKRLHDCLLQSIFDAPASETNQDFTAFFPEKLLDTIRKAAMRLGDRYPLNVLGAWSLLLLIRNKLIHIDEYRYFFALDVLESVRKPSNMKDLESAEVKAYLEELRIQGIVTAFDEPYSAEIVFGKVPDQFLLYFLSRFPKLILAIYNFCLREELYESPSLKRFFPWDSEGNTLFTDTYIKAFEVLLNKMLPSVPQPWMRKNKK